MLHSKTKLPDFMGLNSARHAKRASHVRSHQVQPYSMFCVVLLLDKLGDVHACFSNKEVFLCGACVHVTSDAFWL